MENYGKKKSPIKRILKFVAGFAILGLVIWVFVFLWQKSQPKEIIYEIEEVEVRNIENTSVATGNVSPRDEILIKPQIAGIIESVLKEAGDFVKIGEVIATIKVVPESSSLNAAESQLNIAKINLNLSTTEYNRQKTLFEKGVISKEEMDKAESDYKTSRENADNANDNLDIIRTGVSKKTAKYSNTQVRSTIDGMVLDVPVKVGNSVIQANNFNEGTTIASVANMNDMLFIGKVDETEVGRMHVGMPLKVSVGAVDDKEFEAIMEYIAPKGVEENGAILFEVKAATQIPDSFDIRAGYSANAKVTVAGVKDVLSIPESSITFSNDSAYVYILKKETPKQEFEKTFISIGLSDGIHVQVKTGLKKGEKIRGNEKVEEEKKKKPEKK